jgi:IclR helix-turn-helix domain
VATLVTVNSGPHVTITLHPAQVEQVLRVASGSNGMTELLSGIREPEALQGVLMGLVDDERVSRSTCRALLVLLAFSSGEHREVTEVSNELDLSASTTHRYIRTWVALGLLDQDPATRRYRRPSS